MLMGLLFMLVLSLGNNLVFCDSTMTELPISMQFDSLHCTDTFAAAVKTLKGLAGIYAVKNTITGCMYIGCSVNLGTRLTQHFTDSSNIHLRNAMVHYGIAAFTFIVIEFVEISPDMASSVIKSILLAREQIYLNWLFSLPSEFRYNFLASHRWFITRL